MTERKCPGFPNWKMPCGKPPLKSSKWCRFHLWWLDNYIRVNRALGEWASAGRVLERKEIEKLLELCVFEMQSKEDVLKDRGYTKREHRIDVEHYAAVEKLIVRLRQLRRVIR